MNVDFDDLLLSSRETLLVPFPALFVSINSPILNLFAKEK